MNSDLQPLKIHILVVEDHLLTRTGLRITLERFGNIKIIGEAESGEEATSLVAKCNPDLVLMDIGLKGLSGIEATRKIKEQFPETKIIMLTSHEAEEEIFASFSSGADGYCLKETTPDELRLAIESVYAGNVFLSKQVAAKVLRNTLGKTPRELQGTGRNGTASIPLTEREIEVLKLIVDGKSNNDIAQRLFISLATVKTHVRSILGKLSVDDRTQAAIKALRTGLVS